MLRLIWIIIMHCFSGVRLRDIYFLQTEISRVLGFFEHSESPFPVAGFWVFSTGLHSRPATVPLPPPCVEPSLSPRVWKVLLQRFSIYSEASFNEFRF